MRAYRWSILVSIVLSITAGLLTACGPATPLPEGPGAPHSTGAGLAPAPTPAVLRLLTAHPTPPAALPLRGALVFTFNKPLDPTAVAAAFHLRDANGRGVAGKITFPDERTVRFLPQHPLSPESTYTAQFTTALRAADGTPLSAPISLTYTTEAPFTVLRALPTEGSDHVPVTSDIVVVFNKPVVALGEREQTPNLPLHITPSVTGQGRWVSTAIYLFHPTQPLLSNTRYTVEIPAAVTDREGNTLPHPFRWSFQTAAVRIQRAQADTTRLDRGQTAAYVRLDAALKIVFSAPMDTAATNRAIQVRSHDGKVPKLDYRWNDQATTLTLVPTEGRYTPDVTYELVISKTARAQDGGQLARSEIYRFRTVGQPAILQAFGLSQQYYQSTVTLIFNTYLTQEAVAAALHITPRPPHLGLAVSGRYVTIRGLEPGTTYTITLTTNLTDIFGQKMSTPATLTVTTAHRSPQADFLDPVGALALARLHGPQQFWFSYTNIPRLTLTLYRLSDETLLNHVRHPYGGTSCTSGTRLGTWERTIEHPIDDRIHERVLHFSDLNAGQPLTPGGYCIQMTYPGEKKPVQRTFWFAVVTDQILLQTTPHEALAWVTDADTGAPQSGLPVRLYVADQNNTLFALSLQATDADGLSRWPVLPHPARFALLHTADRFAFADIKWNVNPDDRYLGSYYYLRYVANRPEGPVAFIYTDRPLYRPGQQIFFKGLVRREDDLRYTLPDLTEVWVSLYKQDKMFFQQRLPLSAYGTFHGAVTLPAAAPTGTYSWKITLTPKSDPIGWGSVRVAAYHKPVFQVTLTPDKTTLYPGESTTVHLQATYYAGDAVGQGQVSWYLDPQAYTFQPPEAYADYVFYKVDDLPWDWWEASRHPQTPKVEQRGQGVTDAQGRFVIPLQTDEITAEDDINLNVWSSVTDRGGNTADGFATVVLRQSGVYVGLRSHRWLGVVGQPTAIDLVVLDAAGRPQPHHTLTLDIAREVWHSVQQRDAAGILRWRNQLELVPEQEGVTLTTDDQGEAHFTLNPTTSGTYRLTATTADDAGRTRTASLRLWVAGKQAMSWLREEHSLLLVPDRHAYRPGDTAHLMVPQPFPQPTYGLLTVARGHIFSARVVRLDRAENMLDLPLTPEMAPQVYASLTALRPPDGQTSPDYKGATVRLPVALDKQRLTVRVAPDRTQAAPGERIGVTITTTAAGQPVAAEVSLAVVDKAIYALAPDTFDLLASLYPQRSLKLAAGISLAQALEAYNARVVAQEIALGGGMGSGGGEGKGTDLGGVITLRQNFRDTAYWRAVITTDEQGRAHLTIPLPDNMTTWVLTARAITADSRVGRGSAEITTSRPFFVRLHTPAFFTGGDHPTLQAVVHNTTDQPLTATVRLSRAEGLTLQDPAEQQVAIPAHGQAAVSWQAAVPLDAKRVDLTVTAEAGAYRDAARPLLTTLPDGGIPVQQFVTTEAVGTSGMLRTADEVHEAVLPPPDAPHVTLRLDLAASLTAGLAQTLTVNKAPNTRCTTAWADYLMSNAALAQALQATGATFARQADLDAAIARAIHSLQATQQWDGGWGWCPNDQKSSPTPSALAALALTIAHQAGQPVDGQTLHSAAAYLRYALTAPQNNLDASEQALLIDALARLGQRPTTAAYRLFHREDNHPPMPEAALLLDAALRMQMGDDFTAPLVAHLENTVARSAALAWWDGGPGCWWGWGSNVAATALAVSALTHADPEAPLLPNAVRWLMSRRRGGRWGSDQETAAVALALADWARLSGEAHPNYTAEVLLNGQPQARFQVTTADALQGRSLQWDETTLLPGRPNDLTLRRSEGAGVLYYDAYLQTVLPAQRVRARADGLAVSREYALLDALDTPTTEFPVGAVVQVRLTVVAPHDLHQVVLTDPLPAGLEALDPHRTLTGGMQEQFTAADFWRYGWGGWYFGYREAYDDRVVFVAPSLPAGVYTVTYYARAAAPGAFQARPAVAYAEFAPDVRGRSTGLVVTVTPRR